MKQVTEPHANVRVPTRVYDVEGGAIFAKNSKFVFFDGFAWTPRLRSPSPIMAPGIDYQEISEKFGFGASTACEKINTAGTDENLFRLVPLLGHRARVLPSLELVPAICARAPTKGYVYSDWCLCPGTSHGA